jgi:IPT/TIG domain
MKHLAIILLTALTAATLGCGYSAKSSAAQPGAMPAIAELAPTNTNAGGSAFVLTVNGTNFSSSAAINWNGGAQNTTRISANQLTANIPASAITNPATVPITVTNPGTSMGIYGGGTLPETSNAMNFTVN